MGRTDDDCAAVDEVVTVLKLGIIEATVKLDTTGRHWPAAGWQPSPQ